jgi:ectoine hydroxylase-related dioxygenase (phytanoyl-CoA dioxygenase family)
MIGTENSLSPAQRRSFDDDGYLVLRGALEVERDIEPIRRDLDRLIRLSAAEYSVKLDQAADFDACFLELIRQRPDANSVIYDAAKNLVPFVRLTVHSTIEAIARELRGSDFVGSASLGQGIRIDRPHEMRHLLPWHQDFPYQLRSADGIVFWIPLVSITPDMGPVELCIGSHRLGALPLEAASDLADAAVQEGVYDALRIRDEAELVARFKHVAVTVEPGDVLVFDFLSIHRSGHNVSQRTRWTAQIRYFNFLEEFGRQSGWRGSFKAGKTVSEVNESLKKVLRNRDGR